LRAPVFTDSGLADQGGGDSVGNPDGAHVLVGQRVYLVLIVRLVGNVGVDGGLMLVAPGETAEYLELIGETVVDADLVGEVIVVSRAGCHDVSAGPVASMLPAPAWGAAKGLLPAIVFHIVLNRVLGMMLPGKGVRDRLPAAKVPAVEPGS